MFEKRSKAVLIALRDFVCRHEIFVEAREFDDGFIFVRQAKGQSIRLGPRRGRVVTFRCFFAARNAEC